MESPILLKLVSENIFSGKTYFYTIASRRTTLSEVFLELNLPREARILDVACGTGIVAEELRPHGYDNMDGLDPVKGYLETAQHKKLYRVSAWSVIRQVEYSPQLNIGY